MLDILRRDSKASFFYIGETDEKDEMGKVTRRFRVYSMFTSSTVSENHFYHYSYPELSLYVLVNQEHVEDTDAYAERIRNEVCKAFGG